MYNSNNYIIAVLFIILPVTYLSAMVVIQFVRNVVIMYYTVLVDHKKES